MHTSGDDGAPIRRWAIVGGIAGPALFVAAWAGCGSVADGYSPVDDPISRLAAVGASTRWPMTAGLVAYAVGLAAYAVGVAPVFGRWVARAAAVNALATIAVAVTPLDSALGGGPHTGAAFVGYASLGAVPLLAAGPAGRRWNTGARWSSVGVGVAVVGCLTASAVVDDTTGLWQRLGLTVGDVWLIVTGAVLLRGVRAAGSGAATGAAGRTAPVPPGRT